MNRNQNLERIKERISPWDIVVIGGGATGVGCALDAASRGYEVLLLEQHDFGKGTSSRSTKLIHGGVRYLRQGNISLVREALRERGMLLRNAPHVVHKKEFVVPCYSLFQKLFYGIGLKVYDLLAGKLGIGNSRLLSVAETIGHLPNLKPEGLKGGVLYFDGQFDDTRLLIDMAKAADGQGATLLNYAKVTFFNRDESDMIAGVNFQDVETDDQFAVAAKTVINATGVFCDSVRQMSDDTSTPVITFAQGTHIVLDRRFLPSETAIMIPKTSDGRVLFCIPWHDHLLVGTTDTLVPSAVLEPEALESEIDFILSTAGEYLAQKPTRADILSVFAGIRPLVSNSAAKNTAALSRSHDLFVDDSGLITITGGKWTTYRRMAEDAVNKAAEIGGLPRIPCVTAELAISGDLRDEQREPLHSSLSITRDDVRRSVRDEMAITIEDVLARRTRALFLDAKAAIELAPVVAEIMASELGKDDVWQKDQIERFTELAGRYLPGQSGRRD